MLSCYPFVELVPVLMCRYYAHCVYKINSDNQVRVNVVDIMFTISQLTILKENTGTLNESLVGFIGFKVASTTKVVV